MQDGEHENSIQIPGETSQGDASGKELQLSASLDGYIGQQVVFDISGRYVIAGTLDSFDDDNLYLSAADVHDLRDSSTTRERYILEIGQFGVRPNRNRVVIPRPQVMSFSLVGDIIL